LFGLQGCKYNTEKALIGNEKPLILSFEMKKLFLLNINTLAAVFVGVLLLSSCNTTTVQYDIPEPYVDETVYLSDPSSFNLTVIGGQLYLPNVGHGGVVIYRRYYDQAFYDFAAYELACPYHWADACGLLSSSNGDLYLTCRCGDHQYQLLDGQSVDTSYTLPVKEFNCSFDGVNIIRISN